MNETIPGLIDIVEPAMPVTTDAGVSLLTLSTVAMLMLLAALWRWHHHRHHRRARAQLRNLQKKYSAGELTQRELAYHLAEQLRNHFAQHRLSAYNVPRDTDPAQHAAWQSFLRQLDALRYQPNHQLDMTALLAQARRWLR